MECFENSFETPKRGISCSIRRGTKNIIFLKKRLRFFRKMSHSAENVKGGTLWDLLTYILLQNIKNLEGGTILRHLKIFEKKSHSAEKKSKGELL